MTQRQKVFCIGFHKTGTSSLRAALRELGYSVAGFYEFRHLAKRTELTYDEVLELALKVAAEFDAVQDSPWPIFYRELDAAFPGSKFIHVERDPEAWLRSACNDFGQTPSALRQLIYGSPYPIGNEQAWLDRYHRHNAEVKAYFADRPDDFVSLRLEQGDVSWERLCPFLGIPVRTDRWPHVNTRREKRRRLLVNRLLSRVMSLGRS